MTISPVSAWLNEFEEVALPSGKVVGLRPVDVLNILTSDGRIPNVLLPIIQQQMNGESQGMSDKMTTDDLLELTRVLEKLVRATFVEPRIVDTPADMESGRGILSSMIGFNDKLAVLAWGLGGQAALDAAKTFPDQPNADVPGIPAGKRVPAKSR